MMGQDPALNPLNDSSTAPEACCLKLRCKSMYYRPDERPGRLHFSDTQIYWCNDTQDRLGPDGEIATPRACDVGRPCFRGDG